MEDVKSHVREYKNAKIYHYVMRKVVEKGRTFLQEERRERMKRIREMGVFAKKWRRKILSIVDIRSRRST